MKGDDQFEPQRFTQSLEPGGYQLKRRLRQQLGRKGRNHSRFVSQMLRTSAPMDNEISPETKAMRVQGGDKREISANVVSDVAGTVV